MALVLQKYLFVLLALSYFVACRQSTSDLEGGSEISGTSTTSSTSTAKKTVDDSSKVLEVSSTQPSSASVKLAYQDSLQFSVKVNKTSSSALSKIKYEWRLDNTVVSTQSSYVYIEKDEEANVQKSLKLTLSDATSIDPIEKSWTITSSGASQLPNCIKSNSNSRYHLSLSSINNDIDSYFDSDEYSSHNRDNSMNNGLFPLGDAYKLKQSEYSPIINGNFEDSFTLSSALETGDVKSSIQGAFTVLCATEYDAGGITQENWFQVVKNRMSYLESGSSSDCGDSSSNVLAFVKYDDSDVKSHRTMYFCPSLTKNKNLLDIAVTVLHESRHGDEHGWEKNDFKNVPMKAFIAYLGLFSFNSYFSDYGGLDSSKNYTNTTNIPGFSHSACEGGMNYQSVWKGSPACDPLFIPLDSTNATRIEGMGGGAYSYDVYFYSRVAMGAKNMSDEARRWSCLEGYMLFATRFINYENLAGTSRTQAPDTEMINRYFNYCLSN